MAIEDIDKLKEKVAKDPNSKLFVPLADEYRKMGMLEEAISVLLTGLENQPGYMSARVSLGKIYLEKNMMAEAREEFEKVVSSIPDNLFAHKKLAEIYRGLGDLHKATSEYKTVLRLNPLDEESLTNLDELQKEQIPEKSAVAAPEPPPKELPAALPEVEDFEEEIEVLPAEEISQPVSEDEFEEFKKSIVERFEGEEGEELVAAEEIIEEEDAAEAEEEALTYVDVLKEEEAAAETEKEISFASLLEEKKTVTGEPPEKGVSPQKETASSKLKYADNFILEGNYSKAMKLYRDMLSSDPQNKIVLQKIEELKMLLKMLGKEKEAVIDRLEAFSEGVRKRKDEFLGHP